jgi:hypothetical protein
MNVGTQPDDRTTTRPRVWCGPIARDEPHAVIHAQSDGAFDMAPVRTVLAKRLAGQIKANRAARSRARIGQRMLELFRRLFPGVRFPAVIEKFWALRNYTLLYNWL